MKRLNRTAKKITANNTLIDKICDLYGYGEKYRDKLENLNYDELNLIDILFDYFDDLDVILNLINGGYNVYDTSFEWLNDGLENGDLSLDDISEKTCHKIIEEVGLDNISDELRNEVVEELVDVNHNVFTVIDSDEGFFVFNKTI